MNSDRELLISWRNAVVDAQNKGGLSAVTPWLASLVYETDAALAGKDAELHPALQMALGNHSIGVFKDGKLIAADAEVYMPPDKKDAEHDEPPTF